jgi:predicted flavoprotein YhiN
MTGFTSRNVLSFENTLNGQVENQSSDYCILALGGASWPQTGSDGRWVNMFLENGFHTLPFQSSNCGINIDWPDNIKQFHSGKPLKNITISLVTEEGETAIPSAANAKMNEALITDDGLEGAAVYAIVPGLRSSFAAGKKAFISIDFKPQNTAGQLLKKVSGQNIKNVDCTGNQSKSLVPDYKKLISLATEQMALIKAFTPQNTVYSKEQFCHAVKNLVIPVHSLRPVEEAISVVGGISIDDINENFSLKSNPSMFVIGEMVNWDAPTGGFLLQGCFSMAALVARSI